VSLYTFQLEKDFQSWVMGLLAGQGWHAHPTTEDSRHPGFPDITAAHKDHGEWWLELKCGSRAFSVHDRIKLKHPLTAQQRFWLQRRAASGGGDRCGVLVSFCTGDIAEIDDTIDYVAWVPIGDWDRFLAEPLMNRCLNFHTAMRDWLHTRKCTVADMLRGRLVPGWGGSKSAPSSARPGVTVR
jgi:hypothetical protein